MEPFIQDLIKEIGEYPIYNCVLPHVDFCAKEQEIEFSICGAKK